MPRICVYSGSSLGTAPAYAEAARTFGRSCARRGLGVVYGGGSTGLMGELADAALVAEGEVIGVIPQALLERELAHRHVTTLITVDSMHDRKRRMADLADGFAALPGGIGTLEELVEILTWRQLGLHTKPVGLLDVAGFYAPLVALLDHQRAEGFLAAAHRDLLVVERDPDRLLDRLFP